MYRLALGLVAATLFAQPVPVDTEMANRAKQLLESTQLKDKAWGARLAASLRLPGFEKTLIAELYACQKSRDAATDGPEYAYIQSLFDSLIELEAEVPADAIAPYRSRWKAEAIILLARGRQTTSTLLEMHREKLAAAEWIAITNLLLQRRSAQLLERMLERTPVYHSFFIREPGNQDYFYGPGPSHWDQGEGTRRNLPSGFPPISLYTLTLNADSGNSLIAAGPRNVYFRRALIPTNGELQWPVDEEPTPIIRPGDCELEYLARLGNRSVEEVRRLFLTSTELKGRNATDISRERDKKLDEQLLDIRHFVQETMLRSRSDPFLVRLQVKPSLTDFRRGSNATPPQPNPRELVLDLR